MLLEVNNLVAGYQGVSALHGISMAVDRGEVVAVVGSNGAGKSTLLKTLAGILRPESGEILFKGTNISREPPHRIVQKGIVMVPEGRLLFGRLTVEQNLILGAYTKKSSTVRSEILEEVYQLFPRLVERKKQLAGTLSGGEQQMVAIARGLMSRPELLLLDEPSLGLMPKMVELIFDMINQIKRRGLTILLVEQNVQEALEIADRGYVLQTGKIVSTGRSSDLLSSELIKRAYLGL